jgi:phenylalanine-4-hydroxylase
MNWWTAEYGLIGTLENPKLFGAGLLSSVGEARLCLSAKVKKLPLTVDCIKQSYDITEQQPQLFVTPDFKTLSKVLEEMAQSMAYRQGGLIGLKKALLAKTVNTAEWSSGLQVSGELASVTESPVGTPAYLRFQGPCQLAYEDEEINRHDKTYHSQGFGSPVGLLKNHTRCLSTWDDHELIDYGFLPGRDLVLDFISGVRVEGIFKSVLRRDSKNILITFQKCTVTWGSQRLFEPSWGDYDMAVGAKIESVFGGPADRAAYGETDDFAAVQIPRRKFSETEQLQHGQYQKLRDLREGLAKGEALNMGLQPLLRRHDESFADDWLFRIEALELVLTRQGSSDLEAKLRADLEGIQGRRPHEKDIIADGVSLASQL